MIRCRAQVHHAAAFRGCGVDTTGGIHASAEPCGEEFASDGRAFPIQAATDLIIGNEVLGEACSQLQGADKAALAALLKDRLLIS